MSSKIPNKVLAYDLHKKTLEISLEYMTVYDKKRLKHREVFDLIGNGYVALMESIGYSKEDCRLVREYSNTLLISELSKKRKK